ncbi:NADH dehydrogenase, FAD-containing subunit [Halobacillus karajensis]|uniref:FAD-dependent oxidoreductase n=1 Tax=Halobacillus karajensis TaxID=195088 RepID=UPI0008A7D25A|nr:FAD-dependent oxidoreductase [Halobacillus karajensis]SEI09243.1 NADH dehydrogenase, FAD-containing subunit [Halobacillus karajensis]
MSKRLLLVGAGHAHLEVLKQLKSEWRERVDVCMITPSPYQYYSGMFSGYTEGIYSEEEMRVDIRALARAANVHLIQKKAAYLKADQQKVVCEDGAVYPFDVVSFDIGSKSSPASFEETAVQAIQPNYDFSTQIRELRETTMPLIVGGGAAGTELAMSLQTYKQNHQIPGQVRLILSEGILADGPKWVSAKLRKLLKKKDIRIWENERVEEVFEGFVKTDKGNRVRHTGVLYLGGALGDPIFEKSSLAIDERYFALIRSTLQFRDYDYIFGAGDCVTMIDLPQLEKRGVYAARQGLVLWNNLKNYFSDKPLKSFAPQKKALSILSTGGKKGFFIYGALHAHNQKAWQLKDKMDRAFMAKYKFP